MTGLLLPLSLVLSFATEGSFAGETLRYSINWPTGLSLGEAEMSAKAAVASRVEYEFRLDASLPGFPIADVYRALAGADFCSVEFQKQIAHGSKKGSEKTVFRAADAIAVRQTENGGKSEFAISPCAKDGLTFLYWLRAELQRGRLPSNQTLLFGAAYHLTLRFSASERILVNDRPYQADRVDAVVKGPASETRFEMYFSRDAARRPLKVRVPFAIGSFSMELLD